jgi:hypothetical protein
MLGLALITTVKTAAAGGPGHGAFDRPAVTSQPLGGLNSLAGDAVPDASAAQPSPQVDIVLALVGMELAGPAAPGSPAGAERGAEGPVHLASGRGLAAVGLFSIPCVSHVLTVHALPGWVRIDTWRTNTRLHAYYERLGFKRLRTEVPPHRRSGWLAQRSAGEVTMPHTPLPAGPNGEWQYNTAARAWESPGRQ